MPEGHVLHRAARLQGKRFNGHALSVSSPQGRFSDEAKQLDGQTLETIFAKGKHIFYRFESDDTMHVHLGLFGKYRLNKPPFPEPSPNCRVLMETDENQLHLAGPNQCRILDAGEVDDVLARLGPDPIINASGDREEFISRMHKKKVPVGRALMDQNLMAGVGNVYRSELLFQIGVHPWRKANELDPETLGELWDQSVAELKAGERVGKIVTVEPSDVGAQKRSELTKTESLYAYKRHGDPCRRCETLIRHADIDGRNAWWCPTCQPK